ncbi:serine/threonine-protein kinase [Mycobacterium sp. RTGN5]|uniref:serine/threonine-protein kinase n=1 Tax=Mycobacterium sp. RTGN5 TaxID=3016522 RepID=UPI0029C88B06|nr:serine/threonine-protein kinase [Mycobacterium sp. RTGN5]
MPLTSGATFADFTVLLQLGSGGMGEVYLVRHPRLNRRDALKILPRELADDPGYRARFRREADAAAALWHPHIVGVHDCGEFDGQLWLSMDYVEGTDARALLRSRYPAGMSRDQVVDVVAAVAEALDYAHERGLLHRDVKPANILLTNPTSSSGRVLLADFGIARRIGEAAGLTATNMTVGTADYAAPEQLTGAELDGRADQYALAATAFHLLAGVAPFAHTNPAVVISRHLSAPPPRLAEFRPDLDAMDPVLARALAKEPASRFASCRDFASALRATGPQVGSVPTRAAAPTAAAAPPVATQSAFAATTRTGIPSAAIAAGAGLAAALLVALIFVGMAIGRNDTSTTPLTASPLTPTSNQSAPMTVTVPSTVTASQTTPSSMVLPDGDRLGFTVYGGAARCAPDDQAVLMIRTPQSALVFCRGTGGTAYYRGLRLSDNATLQLDTVTSDGDAMIAINPTDGTRYVVTRDRLSIVQDGEVVAREPALEAWP